MWSGVIDSSGVLLSYPLISLASQMTIILISTLKHTYNLYACRPKTHSDEERVGGSDVRYDDRQGRCP